MENKKFLDLNKIKAKTVSTASPTPPLITPKKAEKKLGKEISVTAEDGSINTVSTWFSLLTDGVNTVVHCPISPESHNNNDTNASCSMKKNGDYLNFFCYGCGNKASVFFGQSKRKSKKESEMTYSVPIFNKQAVLGEVAQGLDSMQSIVDELVKFLPALVKEEKKDD